jgi:hypothetical protein
MSTFIEPLRVTGKGSTQERDHSPKRGQKITSQEEVPPSRSPSPEEYYNAQDLRAGKALSRKVSFQATAKFMKNLFAYFAKNTEMLNLEFGTDEITFSFMNIPHTSLIEGNLTAALLPSYFCEVPCLIGLKAENCHKMFSLLSDQNLLTLSHDPLAKKSVLDVRAEHIIEASEHTKKAKVQRQTSVRKKQRLVFPTFDVDQHGLVARAWPNPRVVTLPTVDYFDLFSALKKNGMEEFVLMISDKYLRLFAPQKEDNPGLDIEWEDLGSGAEKNALTLLMRSNKPKRDLIRVPFSSKLMLDNELLKNMGETITLRLSVVRNEQTGKDEPMPLILALKTEYGRISVHVSPRIEDS